MGVPAQMLAFTGSGTVRSGQTIVKGYHVHETAGAAAQMHIFDNTAASGTYIGSALLAANGSADVDLPGGVQANTGVYVEVVAGAVAGHIRI